jgi:hypothetical protein
VDNIGRPQPQQAGYVEGLVEDGPGIGNPPDPSRPTGEPGIDSQDADCSTLFSKVRDEGLSLNPLTAEDVEAWGDDDDSGAH